MNKKLYNLSGMRFEKLLVIEKTEVKTKYRNTTYRCLCDCGKQILVPGGDLRSHHTKSCGCLRLERARSRFRDLTRQRFGRLIVLEKATSTYRVRWTCQCDCGTKITVAANNLTSGGTKSCGCLNKEATRMKGKNTTPDSGAKMLYHNYKQGARHRKLCFDLTFLQFKEITSGNCHYCGSCPSAIMTSKKGYSPYTYNGIDRKDNSIGYTVKNSLPACWNCNYSKRDLSYSEFSQWLDRMTKFRSM
jgi:hypothetical protein